MADPLVETKLLVPRPRRETVARPRLAALLDRASEAGHRGLGAGRVRQDDPDQHLAHRLINGSPGSAALRTPGRAVRRLGSLDHRDRSPATFWTYPGTPSTAPSPDPPPRRADPAAVPAGADRDRAGRRRQRAQRPPWRGHLVLDDYHLADGPDIAEALTFLVDHLPPPLRLVISTRADPALPPVSAAGSR